VRDATLSVRTAGERRTTPFFVFRLAQLHGSKSQSKPIPLIAKISQETLADMIGTTRSRVSFFLNRFRDLGFIDYNGGGMQIHSSLVSVVLHD
jgi:CRP-like cAMP-binding protein